MLEGLNEIALVVGVNVSAHPLSWFAVGTAFLTGFVFSFNPMSFAAIPVVLAYVTHSQEKKRH